MHGVEYFGVASGLSVEAGFVEEAFEYFAVLFSKSCLEFFKGHVFGFNDLPE